MGGGKAAADRFGGPDPAAVGEGFGDAGLEPFVEQGFLLIECAQAGADDLADRGGAVRFDAIPRRGGERAEGDGDGLSAQGAMAIAMGKIAFAKMIQMGYK